MTAPHPFDRADREYAREVDARHPAGTSAEVIARIFTAETGLPVSRTTITNWRRAWGRGQEAPEVGDSYVPPPPPDPAAWAAIRAAKRASIPALRVEPVTGDQIAYRRLARLEREKVDRERGRVGVTGAVTRAG